MTGTRTAVDTNIIIDFLNGDAGILRKLESCDQVLLPFPVKAELIFGAMCSLKPEQNVEHLRKLFSQFDTINSSSDIEYRYARIKTELKRRGRPIPENDIWIAACAQSAETPLFSRDDHFAEIENLSLVGL